MAREHVLVVEDEDDIAELVEYNLARNGFKVSCVSTGEAGLVAARERQVDLVLLDLMLPGLDGLEVCRQLKADPRVAHVPVVMLTAKGEESDIVAGLELGADDYIPKPFSPKVLVARLRAVLRRRPRTADDAEAPIKLGELTIHPGRHEVRIKGKPVELTATEFKMLRFLATRPGWVFTRYQIVEAVQGEEVSVTDRSVDVHVVALRRKLGPAADCIETVRGVGYRFKDE